ncbi:hypothetical protein BF49_0777 [Bradyrhizobium sp.]|nr:hypothetical protein BF49_0777 [Bradyrhizobium sp.]
MPVNEPQFLLFQIPTDHLDRLAMCASLGKLYCGFLAFPVAKM